MPQMQVLVPDATTNYIENPQLRYDTTGYNAQGSVISRVLDHARFGIASLKVVTSGVALNEGAYYRVSTLTGVSEPITVSAYVRGSGQVRIRLDDNSLGGAEFSSVPLQLDDLRWQRLTVTGRSTGGNDLRLYVETAEGVAKVRTFYLDGLQLERKAYVTSYCDGTRPDCRFVGGAHASRSERLANTRQGGRWYQIAGAQREQDDLYMTVVGGLGMAPIVNHVQDFALQPGGFLDNSKITQRPMTFTFFAKHAVPDSAGVETPVSLQHLHELRQFLINVVKPDLTARREPMLFEYWDGTRPIYFWAVYDGGLEGEWDLRNQFVNSFPLRLLATSPLMQEDSAEAAALDFQDSLASNFCAGRLGGRWSNLNYGMNATPFISTLANFAFDARGRLYVGVGNQVTTVNNNAAALDPLRNCRGLVYWDGEKWVQVGPATPLGGGGAVYCIAIAPTGEIYAGGDFTSIGGVAASNIAKWDGAAWSALGAGLNNICYSLAVHPDGRLFAGGAFTSAGGVTVNRVARWDGGVWASIGASNTSTCGALTLTQNGTVLYLIKDSTVVQRYYVDSGVAPATIGNTFNNTISSLKCAPNTDMLYCSGGFTACGSDVIYGVARWNGSAWLAVGGGIVAGGSSLGYLKLAGPGLSFFSNGNLLLTGAFTRTTNNAIYVEGAAVFDGTSWKPLDLWNDYIASSPTNGWTGLVNPATDDIYLFGGSGQPLNTQVRYSGQVSVNNPGTAECQPTIYIKGSGLLRWIENLTTGRRMQFNLTIFANEEVFIDTRQGLLYSTLRGNLLYSLLPGGDFRNFVLAPGLNTLTCLIAKDTGAQAQLYFEPQHWGVDATG